MFLLIFFQQEKTSKNTVKNHCQKVFCIFFHLLVIFTIFSVHFFNGREQEFLQASHSVSWEGATTGVLIFFFSTTCFPLLPVSLISLSISLSATLAALDFLWIIVREQMFQYNVCSFLMGASASPSRSDQGY